MIRLDNVTKVFGRGSKAVRALDHVTLHVKPGSYIGVSGRSGSGKTTLLNIISGLEKPTAGSIIVDSLAVNTASESELAGFRNRSIGFVFQSFHLNDWETSLENVILPLLFSNVHAAERSSKAFDVLKKLGLEDKIHSRVLTLSSGQRQRVALARALITSPRILLADEPTANIDVESESEIMNILDNLVSEGMTVLLVSHDPKVLERAPHIIVTDRGRITRY